MNDDQVRRQILAMFYDERVEEVTPAFLSYRLHMQPKQAEGILDAMVLDGMLELDSDEGGNLFYCLPDNERERLKRMPPPEKKPDAPAGPPPGHDPYAAPNAAPSFQQDMPGKGGRRSMPGRGGPAPYSQPAPYGPPPGYHGGVQPGYEMMRAGGNQMTPYGLAPNPQHNPGVAVVLSILFPGAGQIYNGQVGKGIAVFLSSTIGMIFLFGFFVWFWSLFDAHNVAKKIQSGIPV